MSAAKRPLHLQYHRQLAETMRVQRVAMKVVRWRSLLARNEKLLLLAAGALIAFGITLGHAALTPAAPRITQKDIDAAVTGTLQTKPAPSPAARAYQVVRGSIVRVRATGATGTGVVVINRGVILTSLHVLGGETRARVLFENGLESDATLIKAQPENDIAVLQAE